MEHLNVESIYNQIVLLSDTDKEKLYQRIHKELRNSQKVVAYTTAGQSLTEKQYVEKIEQAIRQADMDELITDKELQKEINTW
jgi:hypothetical protein